MKDTMTGTKGSNEGKGPGEGESDASVPRAEPSDLVRVQAQLRNASKAACDLLGEIAKHGLAQGGEQSPNRHQCLDTAGTLAYWLAFTEDPMHARVVADPMPATPARRALREAERTAAANLIAADARGVSPAARTILALVRRARYRAAKRDLCKAGYTHTRGQLEGAVMEADYAARMLAVAAFRRTGKWRTP